MFRTPVQSHDALISLLFTVPFFSHFDTISLTKALFAGPTRVVL